MIEMKNAKIQSVRLGNLDGRFWGAQICFNYGGGAQSVHFKAEEIRQLLETVEIVFWESLPDTNCRVKASGVQVFEIGHFMKDRWFKLNE